MANNTEPTAKIRLAKRMADAGLCSRREAERWIAEGRVRVNDTLVETPATLVCSEDAVVVDGKLLGGASVERLFLYHKPAGLLTTHRDPQGRPTVFETLPEYLPRVVSVGRLDLDSEGLLLLTTSGALARQLELPKTGLARTYRVRLHGVPTDRTLSQLAKGITVEGVHYGPIEVRLETEKASGRNRWAVVTLHEGKNREIRRVFEHFGHSVSRLIRISYGPFSLGKMSIGDVHEVKDWQKQLEAV
jgi:23S rRNA pseudouridine2605 synthase